MDRCFVKWNPGTWPYVTHCVLKRGHEGDHQNNKAQTCPNVPGQERAEVDNG
jgi:hypothetical protein